MRTSLVALLTGALIIVPVVSGCGDCKGTVQHRTLAKGGGYTLRVHNNTSNDDSSATFCEVSGTQDRFADCDAGAPYPKCSK